MTEIGSIRSPQSPPLTFTRWVAGIVVRWRVIVAVMLVILALAALSLVVVPPSYSARASFVANLSTTSKLGGGAAGGAGGSFGGLANQLGLSPGVDPTESPKFYERLLHSRELLTRLLESRFPDPRSEGRDSAALVDILSTKNQPRAEKLERQIKRLDRSLRTDLDPRANIVDVRITTRWPELSAGIVNRAVTLVAERNREQRTQTMASRRAHFEERLAEARDGLQTTELQLRNFHEQNRSWQSSPSLVIEEQQLRRRSFVADELYMSLQRQYDAARLEELNSAALVTVLDSAVVAQRPQWPRLGSLFATALIVGAIVGSMTAGAVAIMDDWRNRNPDGARSFGEALRRARTEIGSTLRRRRSRRRRVA